MNSTKLTAEEARKEYVGKVNITAQADYDRWPEANGMRRRLFELADIAGITVAQVQHDLKHANIDCTGGRW